MTADRKGTQVNSVPPPIPTIRVSPVDPPEEYGRLRDEAPVRRHRWPNGVEGRLVARHADVRTLLADPRPSVNRFEAPPPTLSFGRKGIVMLPSLAGWTRRSTPGAANSTSGS